MAPIRRNFTAPEDFERVSHFLFSLYQPHNRDGNWFQPIWEYAYTHPLFETEYQERIGIWEDGGKMVAVVNYEWALGEAFFAAHADYQYLKPEMLTYAEEQLAGVVPEGADKGKRSLRVYLCDFDKPFVAEALSRGYWLDPDCHRPMCQYVIPDPFPSIILPEGFTLRSLDEDNDLAKVNRVLWRGFDHEGEPPPDVSDRRHMQSGPHYRKEHNIVVVSPNGEFVAFAGQWFEAVNKFGYVEPVATDPDYRRMGLGKAAVLEGIRRSGELGADVAYVGVDKQFYLAIGFRILYVQQCWIKTL